MPCRSKESDHLSTLYISKCRFHIKRSLRRGTLLYFSSCSFFFTVFVIKQKRAHDGNSYIYDIGIGWDGMKWDGIFREPLFLSFNGFYCWLYYLFLVSNSIKSSNAPVQSILFLMLSVCSLVLTKMIFLHWSFCVNNLRHLHYRYFFFICQRNRKIYIELSLRTHLIKIRFENEFALSLTTWRLICINRWHNVLIFTLPRKPNNTSIT